MLFCSFLFFVSAQTAKLSLKSKNKIDYCVTSAGDTIKVGDFIQYEEPNITGSTYRYVSFLNKINEPIKNADTRIAFKKEPILFFKEDDGVFYAFTKFTAINVEGAVRSKEIIVLPPKETK